MKACAFRHRGQVLNGGYEYKERIRSRHADAELLDYLADTYPNASREEWTARIDAQRVSLDGQPATRSTRLRVGQLLVWARPPWDEPDVPLAFDVLHEDDALIVVSKPEGLPTNPGGGEFLEHTLLHQVRKKHGANLSPVHRLGRGTSGLVIFARTSEAARVLVGQWNTKVTKVYLARVDRAPGWTELEIDVAIGQVPHAVMGRVAAACADGRPSSTVVRRPSHEDPTLIEARILTGRPHQIRIHLAAVGHPLSGDPFYGANGLPREDSKLVSDIGYRLHAWRVTFEHPITGAPIEVTAPPPAWALASGPPDGRGE